MATLTQTSKEFQAERRNFLTSMFVRIYFRDKAVYTRDHYMDILMEIMFNVPSVSRSLHRKIYLRNTSVKRAFQGQLEGVFGNMAQGKTMDNLGTFEEMIDTIGQLDDRTVERLPWLLR